MKNRAIYRCCEAETTNSQFKHIRPDWFCKKKSFKSFWDSATYANCDVTILHDGAEGDLLNYINSVAGSADIVKINVSSNLDSLLHTFTLADRYFNSGYDSIYFIEDDYLHTLEAVDVIFKGANRFNLVTGFDHLDRYLRSDDITLGREYIAFSKSTNRHWRTVESTTCTWACTKHIWLSHLAKFARMYTLQDRELFRALIHENIRLWSPIPGVTTTLDVTTLSPGIDWKTINTNIIL